MAAQPASASTLLTLQVLSGTTLVTIVDGSGGDTNSNTGIVGSTDLAPVGNWNLSVTGKGTAFPVLSLPSMDLSFDASENSGTSDTLTFALTLSGIDTSFPTIQSVFAPTNTNTSVSYSIFYDTTAADTTYYDTTTKSALAGQTLLAGPDTCNTNPCSQQTLSGAGPTNTPYSLTMLVTITGLAARGTTSLASEDLSLNAPAPEPGSLLLLGSGLVGIGAAIRRRRHTASK